jgi:FkbM family methyltransferase
MPEFKDKTQQIENGFRLFKDTKSKELYEALLLYKTTKKILFCSRHEQTEQYFPPELINKIKIEHFVDCGAYIGDSLKRLNTNCGKIKRVTCFEPVFQNFSRLCCFINEHFIAETVVLFLNAVWSCQTTKKIISCQNMSRIVYNDEHIKTNLQDVMCLDLDSAISGLPPTYIKMDIEGAELEALRGAQKIIKKYRPTLAISVYHNVFDFFEVPLLLDSWHLDYTFYLRCYEKMFYETILYAIPKEFL